MVRPSPVSIIWILGRPNSAQPGGDSFSDLVSYSYSVVSAMVVVFGNSSGVVSRFFLQRSGETILCGVSATPSSGRELAVGHPGSSASPTCPTAAAR